MELVPIKVKIGLRANGHADHPQWTLLPMIANESQEKQYMPHGWMYDKAAGHREARSGAGDWDSPIGMQWGCLLVTQQFADEAVETFPTLVTIITEAEFESFYDGKCMAHLTENKYDIQTLEGLKLEHDIKVINGEDVTDIKARMAKAVDPNDDTPGVVKNKERVWADRKVKLDVSIKTVAEI